MVTPRPSVMGYPTEQSGLRPRLSERAPRPDRQPQRAYPLTRRYEVSFLTPHGEASSFTSVAPATPVFEDAFAALARGTILSTEFGPTAVEDLHPGTRVDTVVNGLQPLQWVGSITVFPATSDVIVGEATRLTRLAPDTFGLGRPMPDLVLGPRARVLCRHARCREMLGTSQAFAPARAFADGVNVIEVSPITPVRVYHLVFHGQQTVLANGIEIETYHPGPQIDAMMDQTTQKMFLDLFPHIENFDQFGPMDIPRLTAFELETLRHG